jgi:hypothetical protein
MIIDESSRSFTLLTRMGCNVSLLVHILSEGVRG